MRQMGPPKAEPPAGHKDGQRQQMHLDSFYSRKKVYCVTMFFLVPGSARIISQPSPICLVSAGSAWVNFGKRERKRMRLARMDAFLHTGRSNVKKKVSFPNT